MMDDHRDKETGGRHSISIEFWVLTSFVTLAFVSAAVVWIVSEIAN